MDGRSRVARVPLHQHLESLYADTSPARIQRDPLRFAHRYPDARDAEIAGLIAALYAFGRVDLFLPVLDRLFAVMDTHGGPRAFVDGFGPDHAPLLAGITYRWTRPADLAVFLGALRRVLAGPDLTLEDLFRMPGTSGAPPPLRARLGQAIGTLRGACLESAAALGSPTRAFSDLPQGVRYLLPAPDDGSACKRWNLYLRWMVRPSREGIDLGLWTTLTPAELVMPLDVHVGRLSRFLGLTTRTDASWRTAEEITASLRAFDPADPVRFDFALAHHGISGACLGFKQTETCAGCAIRAVCRAPDRAAPR